MTEHFILRYWNIAGKKVKVIYFLVSEDKDAKERLDFLAAMYLAAIEDDEEETPFGRDIASGK